MQLHVLIRYGTLINNVWMTKSELRIKQMGLPLIISNVTNDIKWTLQNLGSQVFKNHNFNPFQSSSLFIRASVAVAMLFIPSSHVLSSYFLCFTQFGGGQHCFNFDKFHDTAPLQKQKTKKKKKRRKKRKEGRKNEWKKERRKKNLSNLFFLFIQLHDRRFILFFRFSYRHLCCVWLLTASSLSFLLFSFLFMFFFFIWFIFAVFAFRFFRFSFLEKD